MTAGPSGSMVERAVRLAARAPSLHNSQPWRWRVDGDLLDLYPVDERLVPATDRSGRQLLISCGVTCARRWRLRLERLLHLLRADQVNPTPMTTHEFAFDDMERRSRCRTRNATMSRKR